MAGGASSVNLVISGNFDKLLLCTSKYSNVEDIPSTAEISTILLYPALISIKFKP